MKSGSDPKVSILIPIYNMERYLAECLDSVVNQTLDDIEIICVNDGSTDHSLDIIQQFAKKDRRILVLNGPNAGYGKAMNRALDAARGNYIGIVEPDDYVRQNMYEILYQTAVTEKADLVKADFYLFDDLGGKRTFEVNQTAKIEPELYNCGILAAEHPIVFRFTMNIWSGIYRRSFLMDKHIRFHETPGASYQDNGFWFQTFCHAEKMYFLNQPFYKKRRDNPDSSVHNPTKEYCMCEEYEYIYQFLQNHPAFKERYVGYYQIMKYHSYMMIFHLISDQRKWEFIKRMHKEFRASYEKNELPKEVFMNQEWDEIQELIMAPEDYYVHKYAGHYKNQAAQLEWKISKMKEVTAQLEREIAQMKGSRSWKLGRAIVYIPKKICVFFSPKEGKKSKRRKRKGIGDAYVRK